MERGETSVTLTEATRALPSLVVRLSDLTGRQEGERPADPRPCLLSNRRTAGGCLMGWRL